MQACESERKVPCEYAKEVVDFISGRGYSIGYRGEFAKHFLLKISQK